MSFDVILPFLRPIEPLLLDPSVTEIMVNGSGQIFIERQGLLEAVDGVELDERNLEVAVRNMARALGDDVSEDKPLLDSRLPDGSRVAADPSALQLGRHYADHSEVPKPAVCTVSELLRTGTLTPLPASAHSVTRWSSAEREHPHQRRDGDRQDDGPECAGSLPPVRGPHHPDRGHGRTAAREAEPRTVRGSARTARRPAGQRSATC